MLNRLPILALAMLIAMSLTACSKPADQAADASTAAPADDAQAQMPDDDVHRQAMASADDPHASMSGMMGGALNREVVMDDSIRTAWRAILVEYAELETGVAHQVEIPFGETAALGDTGLTLEAVLFVPDFVMDEGGITSRSADPANPAAKVVIREDGAEDYEGWLFATMPGIHPFPHETYRVTLLAGVPTE